VRENTGQVETPGWKPFVIHGGCQQQNPGALVAFHSGQLSAEEIADVEVEMIPPAGLADHRILKCDRET
jgi:hypothetical protein